ncbi:Alvin_2107 family globule sulfur oxidation protein [Kaarinaea lacus]
MNTEYYESIDKMEKAKVSREYIVGWASGYLQNPMREEQRVTEAYEAGYNDGQEKKTDNYKDWIEK